MREGDNVALIVIKESNNNDGKDEVVLEWKGESYTFEDLVSCGSSSRDGIHVLVDSNRDSSRNRLEQLEVIVSTSLLLGAIGSWFLCSATGYQAIFPSSATTGIVLKITIWLTIFAIATTNQYHYWYPLQRTLHITLSTPTPTTTTNKNHSDNQTTKAVQPVTTTITHKSISSTSTPPTTTTTTTTTNKSSPTKKTKKTSSTKKQPKQQEEQLLVSSSSTNATTIPHIMEDGDSVPFRFIRATKGDIKAAKIRWSKTLEWRESMGMDTILQEPHPNLSCIKQNYPHYFHLRGKKNEACYYESPPKMKLKALKEANITMDDMLRHYVLCCEFMWTVIEPNEEGKSIYVINLDGMGMRDFAGDVVDFVKRASAFTSEHYPERSGTIFVVNVPSWFSIIWNAVKGWVDDVTKQKIKIIKSGNPQSITKALLEKIELHNIPPEYGGTSMPLGQSPEEEVFAHHFAKLNNKATTKPQQPL